jgi:hypothetical protein
VLRRAATLTYTLHGLKRRFFLDENKPVFLGRSMECDIFIPQPGVAPIQCRFERSAQGELLIFSESDTLPTLVNGYPAQFAMLSPGDTIRIGPVIVEVGDRIVFATPGTLPDPAIFSEQEFGRAMIQSLKRSHWFALSLAIHLAVLFLYANLQEPATASGKTVGIMQDWAGEPAPDVEFDEDDFETSKMDDDFPPEPDLDDPLLNEHLDGDQDSAEDLLGYFEGMPGSTAGGRSGGEGLLSLSSLRSAPAGDKGWNRFTSRLRHKGIDVAILFDSTGSMSGFIREVKSTIREMIHVLTDIVPNCSICLMTYKGDSRSSDYVINSTPLVQDPFELLNFMQSVVISGGSAEGFAAIGTALEATRDGLYWREGTEKVIVIIGDAPPFPWKKGICLDAARRFKGKVASIYKQSSGVTLAMEPETKSFFRKLSSTGGGPFLLYDEGEGDVVRRIVSAVLGTEWEEQIEEAFERKQTGRWRKVVERKILDGNFEWLIAQFKKRRVRPEVVDALVTMGGPAVVHELWKCLLTEGERIDSWLLHRVLYVLQPLVDLQIDYTWANRNQLTPSQMLYIAEAIKHTYGPGILEMAKRD